VELYVPLIRGWLRRYNVSPEDAEDLAQDVMALVVREMPDFQHNQQAGAFRKWLRTITVNRLRMLWRARQGKAAASGNSEVLQMLDQLEDPNSGLSRVWDEQHNQHVARRLMALIQPEFTAKTWEAFRRAVLDSQKPAAIAQDLGISVNAVLLAKSRVLKRLRQEMRGLTE
jgi:RNA polymerase sigma-70 factor (ECF subfamily)